MSAWDRSRHNSQKTPVKGHVEDPHLPTKQILQFNLVYILVTLFILLSPAVLQAFRFIEIHSITRTFSHQSLFYYILQNCHPLFLFKSFPRKQKKAFFPPTVVYMRSSFFQLAPWSRDLSQLRIVWLSCKAEQIKIITSRFVLGEQSCYFESNFLLNLFRFTKHIFSSQLEINPGQNIFH